MNKKHLSGPIYYLFLTVILIAALFIRVYRIDQILGFYYDQGRDAQVIWDLIHHGKFFLIGPTTGIEGIFRGPFYYYLIAPFYWLGGGNPVWPSVFLAATSVLAIIIIYYLGVKIAGRMTGLMAAVLASFSYNIFYTSRWLSNPTPMLLLSMVLVWAMLRIFEKGNSAPRSLGEVGWEWPTIAFVSGLSLFHFGSAGEIFYFPAIAIFAVWTFFRQGYGGKSSLNNKVIITSLFLFVLTFAPLVLFDLKHDGILRNNIVKFFVADKSFSAVSWRFASDRLAFFYDAFTNKVFHTQFWKEKIFLGALAFFFVYYLSRLLKNDGVKILILLLVCPVIGLIFFQGNFGNFYDYYLTGYYLIFLLLVAVVLGHLWKTNVFGKAFAAYFIYFFLTNNLPVIKSTITDLGTDERSVAFSNQKKAIDWVYKDAGGRNFNVDIYVPPVIPYAYNYLFTWLGTTKYHKLPEEREVIFLYTLYEPENYAPERLIAWLDRQKGIGNIKEEVKFGGITVQRRLRIEK